MSTLDIYGIEVLIYDPQKKIIWTGLVKLTTHFVKLLEFEARSLGFLKRRIRKDVVIFKIFKILLMLINIVYTIFFDQPASGL